MDTYRAHCLFFLAIITTINRVHTNRNTGEQDIYLVTDYMDGGTLYAYIRDFANEYTFSLAVRFAMDCVRGMAYLHDRHVMQRDLKSQNLLVQGETIKIAGASCCV